MSQELPANVIDVTPDTFSIDVIERSHSVPVVVDFWAAWCGPCRALAPVLERLAADYEGRFILARADVDRLTDVARQYRVQSIPTVVGFRKGQPVDSFVGVLPEAEIRAFVNGLMPTEADNLISQADQLIASDTVAAEAAYRQAIALAPRDPGPQIGLARLMLQLNRDSEVRTLIAGLEKRGYLEPEAETIKAELTLRDGAAEAGSVEAARRDVATAPNDLAARLRLAEALAAARQDAEALETALDLVERDRTGTGEPARKLMLALFQLLPPDSELVADYRRRLSFVL